MKKISILQGSILGPILFLCYINDLYRVTDLFTLMFADDTFSAKSGSNLDLLVQHVNTEINKMAIWFHANKLAVNKSKTKYIFRTTLTCLVLFLTKMKGTVPLTKIWSHCLRDSIMGIKTWIVKLTNF